MKTIKTIGGVILTSLLCAGVLYAATTIGENITTAGNLEVTGNATTTGSLAVGSSDIPSGAYSLLVGKINTESIPTYGIYASTTYQGANALQYSYGGYFETTTPNEGFGGMEYGAGIGVKGKAAGIGSATYGYGGDFLATGFQMQSTGVRGSANSSAGDNKGVYGIASTGPLNHGGYFSASSEEGGIAYGIYSIGSSGAGTNYAGYFDGNVKITAAATTTDLTVTNGDDQVGQVLCYLDTGKIGHCTSVVGETGACTCAEN